MEVGFSLNNDDKCNNAVIFPMIYCKSYYISAIFAAMKIFAFIMAFLVIGISCLPCADGDFAISTSKMKAEQVVTTPLPEDANHNDECSPFCQCSCCASISIKYISSIIAEPFCKDDRLFIVHKPNNIIQVSLPIWQPPQLV